jgi:hypothetical protein
MKNELCQIETLRLLMIGRIPKFAEGSIAFISYVAGAGMVAHRTESAAKNRIKKLAKHGQENSLKQWQIVF